MRKWAREVWDAGYHDPFYVWKQPWYWISVWGFGIILVIGLAIGMECTR